MKIIKIPELFKKFDNKEMFSECLVCKKNLLDDNTEYIIEKAVRNYPEKNTQDIIFEYALCFDCINNLKSELSKESTERIQNYFNNNLYNLSNRINNIFDNENDYTKYIEHCIITGNKISNLDEYVLQAHCKGENLVLSVFPLAISEKVFDDISELLSNKTLDFLNGFMDDYFDYPPEFREILKHKPIFI